MEGNNFHSLINTIDQNAHPINNDGQYIDHILNNIGDAKIVLLGIGNMGCRENYELHANIIKSLVVEKGFNAIASASDFLEGFKANQYINKTEESKNTLATLSGYYQFPKWLWHNQVMCNLLEWLKNFNIQKKPANRVNIFGLDTFNLPIALEFFIHNLLTKDIRLTMHIISNYYSIDHCNNNILALKKYESQNHLFTGYQELINRFINLLTSLYKKIRYHKYKDFFTEYFNNRIHNDIDKSSNFYRNLINDPILTWNRYNQEMFNNLLYIDAKLKKQTSVDSKIIILGNNILVGNNKATEFQQNETSLGEIVKDHYGNNSFTLGTTANTGRILAANCWGEGPMLFNLPNSIGGSYEHVFQQSKHKNFILPLSSLDSYAKQQLSARLLKHIGVIYRQGAETLNHYYLSELAKQFDCIAYFNNCSNLSLSQWDIKNNAQTSIGVNSSLQTSRQKTIYSKLYNDCSVI